MEQTKLEEFNKELKVLLDKYEVTLVIEQKIAVAPKPIEPAKE